MASVVLAFEIMGLTCGVASAQQSNLLWRATIQVGKTPIHTRVPHGYFRWRISKLGFATAYTAQPAVDLRIGLRPAQTGV